MRLAERRDDLAGTLSGGSKQRLALGCAVLHEPPVLFLDEPTAGVDPAARRLFWNLIRSLAHAGTAIIVTTHYMDEAEHFDRLAFLSNGHRIALGTPSEVRAGFGAGSTLEDIFVRLQEQGA
jgi:ABC-2 type transport system ATP-binding protein